MSRAYSMSAVISGFDPKRKRQIEEAAREMWTFDEAYSEGKSILHLGTGDGDLTGGEGEEEFADEFAKAIWKANKKSCVVTVKATYLEVLPCEFHVRAGAAYKRLMKKERKCVKK